MRIRDERGRAPWRRRIALALVAGAGACAHVGPPPSDHALTPGPDSVTTALWHFDESGGTRAADAGPLRLDGSAGVGTRTDFGRFGNARQFTRVLDSFVLVPYDAALDLDRSLTIEAWISVDRFGQYEDTPIAGRWSQEANHQSWLFSVVGFQTPNSVASLPTPGFHNGLVQGGRVGHLLFAYQPEDASAPRSFFSAQALEVNRWTHVAATFDGEVVKLYIDGRLDSQYATLGHIRASQTPILIGNYFDTRRLSNFGGDLRVEATGDPNPYYAFEGFIDELRLSHTARSVFTSTTGR